MRYAIVINLDYDSHPYDNCKLLWDEIKDKMIQAGFRGEGRIFTVNLPEREACDLARSIIEAMEEHQDFHAKRVFRYIKDFYGFDTAHTTNLLVPPTDDIKVSVR